jgi:hypothetical protein
MMGGCDHGRHGGLHAVAVVAVATCAYPLGMGLMMGMISCGLQQCAGELGQPATRRTGARRDETHTRPTRHPVLGRRTVTSTWSAVIGVAGSVVTYLSCRGPALSQRALPRGPTSPRTTP